MLLSRTINSLLVPLIIFISGLWLIYHDEIIPGIVKPLLVYLPLVASIVILLVSYHFYLFRLFTLSVLFSLWYLLVQFQLGPEILQESIISTWLGWLVPLLAIIISWLPERGILTAPGLVSWLVLGGVIIGSYLLLDMASYHDLANQNITISKAMPLVIMISLSIAMIHQLAKTWLQGNVLDGVIFFIVITLFCHDALVLPSTDSLSISHLLIQVLLVWSLIKHSHDMAYRDELTGLPGRRALNEWMKAPGRKYVIAMTDIDHFKKFNDKHGHDVGDDVLKIVASRLAKVTGGGKAFRYGGEEFTIVFRGKEIHQCIPHLEAVREDVAHYKISLREKAKRPKSRAKGKQQRGRGTNQRKISVTTSIGVAAKMPERSAEEVIKAADKALYKAKKAGRNCTVADK